MNKELKIHAAVVTVKMVTVDGKKMTKAVFDQIIEENPFEYGCDLSLEGALGFVRVNQRGHISEILLYINKDNELRKTQLSTIRAFAEDADSLVDWLNAGIECHRVNDFNSHTSTKIVTQEDENLNRYFKIKQNAKEFWNAVKKMHVFIAT